MVPRALWLCLLPPLLLAIRDRAAITVALMAWFPANIGERASPAWGHRLARRRPLPDAGGALP